MQNKAVPNISDVYNINMDEVVRTTIIVDKFSG